MLLDVADVAAVLSTSREFVRRLIRAGKLPAVRVGRRQYRIDAEDLEAFIDARRTRGESPQVSKVGGSRRERTGTVRR